MKKKIIRWGIDAAWILFAVSDMILMPSIDNVTSDNILVVIAFIINLVTLVVIVDVISAFQGRKNLLYRLLKEEKKSESEEF